MAQKVYLFILQSAFFIWNKSVAFGRAEGESKGSAEIEPVSEKVSYEFCSKINFKLCTFSLNCRAFSN